ncbi:MAG: hypothetical protein ACFCU4_10300 [Puniceicoccaceae bacterium]
MPIFRYAVFDEGGNQVEVYEADQKIGDLPLERHPITGERMERLFDPPNLNVRYPEKTLKTKLEPENLEKKGFTKYLRDPLNGTFHKVNRGQGPETIDPR